MSGWLRHAFGRHHAEPGDLAGGELRRRRGHGDEHRVEVARREVLDRRAAAAIGHMRQLRAGGGLEQFAHHVRRRADAARAIGVVPGPRLREGREFRRVACRQRRVAEDQQRRRADHGDRHQVLLDVIGHARLQGGHDGEGQVREQQRVAIRRGSRDVFGAEHRAGARAVLDHDRLPERGTEPRLDQPRQHVRRPARGEGHHQADRPVRPLGLREGGRGKHGPRRAEQGPSGQPIGRSPHHSAMKLAIVCVHVRRSSIEVRSSNPCATSPLGP